MLELLARGAQILAAVGGAYLIALWFVLIVWTYRDIESRSNSVVTQVVSTLLVVLFYIPGVLLYLLLRPKETLDQAFQKSLEEEYLLQDLEDLPDCPSCHRSVRDDYVLCPHCHAQLRESCVNCGKLVDLRWSICPYCATSQHGSAELAPKVEVPAARWVAPTARRRRVGAGESAPRAIDAESAAAMVAAVEAGTKPTTEIGTRSVRPLDRFRGRAIPSATVPANGEATPSPSALGTDLLRSMSAYQAIGTVDESGNGGSTGAARAKDDKGVRTGAGTPPDTDTV